MSAHAEAHGHHYTTTGLDNRKIAIWAFDNGRSRVGVLVGGWPAWQDAGYPVEPKPA